MMNPAGEREFSVHARHAERHHARLVRETSFEAAAIAFAEDFPSQVGDAPELCVIVRESASGHEHCFRIDLATGETDPCG